MGMRAQESANRKKLIVFKQNKQNTIKDRDWFDWLPIHSMTTREVFETIKESGQKPFWTYSEGMSRKSCAFCIMANNNDLKIAAMLRPELAKKYIDAEERLGFTLKMDKTPLKQIIAE